MKHSFSTNQVSKAFNCHGTSHLIGFEDKSNGCIWSFGTPSQSDFGAIDAIITTPDFPLGHDELIKMPKLKVVSSYGVGYDYIDVQAASKLGILVTHTPSSVTLATAELGLSLILASVRNIVEHDRLIRSKDITGSPNEVFKHPIMAHDFSTQVVGIIGYGRIGKNLFSLVQKVGFKAFYNRAHGPLDGHDDYKEIAELLSSSDVVVLCVPLNPDTHHLIDVKSFELMKPNAKIINISRGPCVDELSLIEALKTHRISGAALDVFEYEPHINQELIQMDQVILSPHVGTTTAETRKAMTAEAVENIVQALNKTPQNSINLSFWDQGKF